MIDLTKDIVSYYTSFYGFPEHLGERIAPYLRVRQIKRNDVLIHPGQVCTTGYIVAQGGIIQSYVNAATSEEKVVSFFLPTFQPFCTITDSYFTGTVSQCKLFAFKNTTIASIERSDLERVVASDPEVRQQYMDRLNQFLVFENTLRMKLITLTPDQFYHFLLEEYPQLIKKVSTKYIAQFMGISREWLSKIKSNKS